MPLAMINVRLDAALKERVDPKLQQMGYSATQAIAALYQYIDQNDSLPFTIETRVYRPEESLHNTLDGLLAARPRLAEISRLLTAEVRQKYAQELAIDVGMIKEDMRLYDAAGRAGEHLQHYGQGTPRRQLPVPHLPGDPAAALQPKFSFVENIQNHKQKSNN